eukprot:15443426-Alexandrium_andersonii.AAC.1
MGYEQLTAAWFRPIGLMPMAPQDQASRACVAALEADAKSRCFVVTDGGVRGCDRPGRAVGAVPGRG